MNVLPHATTQSLTTRRSSRLACHLRFQDSDWGIVRKPQFTEIMHLKSYQISLRLLVVGDYPTKREEKSRSEVRAPASRNYSPPSLARTRKERLPAMDLIAQTCRVTQPRPPPIYLYRLFAHKKTVRIAVQTGFSLSRSVIVVGQDRSLAKVVILPC